MKTRIFGDFGTLECVTSKFNKVTFIFPTSTLADWYPLDVGYEYRYNETTDKLYLIPISRNNIRKSYGIESACDRMKSDVASFKVGTWFCKEVADENKATFKKAKNIGLTTLEEQYDHTHVNDNMEILLNGFEDNLLAMVEERMMDSITEEEYQAYRRQDVESRDVIRLAYSSEEDDELFYLYGKLRVMNNLMRQGACM